MTLEELLESQIGEQLIMAVMSGERNGSKEGKVRIRPMELKGELCFQASKTEGTKVLHKNYSREELLVYMKQAMEENYTQLQLQGYQADGSVLVSKKGKMTVKQKQHANPIPARKVPIQAHNRKKNYILKEGIPVPFLVDLGVMTPEGKIVASRYDKFRQMNRFLEFIEDVLPKLPRDREATILDFGCGKSYLTFAMYYYFRELKGMDIRIIGLDLKKEVIESCSQLASVYGYEKLTFLTGDIAEYEGGTGSGYGCDTACL